MWFSNCLRNRTPNRGCKIRPKRRPSLRFRPGLEALDDLIAPAQVNLTVSSLADSGAGTLRAAILSADAGKPSDKFTIDFAVTGTIDLQSPLPDLNNTIAIQGPGAGSLTVERAAGASFSSAIIAVDAGQTASVSGLTIANGNHGGIFNDSGTLTVANSAVVNNSFFGDGPHGLVAQGGGIFNLDGSLTVTGSTISGNTASYAGGISSSGSLTISGSTVSNNSAPGTDDPVTHNHIAGSGGGMIALRAFTVSGCTFSGNSTDGAGGGMQGGGTSSQAATITGCTFTGNSAFWGAGVDDFSFLTVSNCTLSDNIAQGGGGGMRIGGPTTVSGCTFSHNKALGFTSPFGFHIAGSGGALDMAWPNNTVRDCTFTGNSAELGGAIYGGDMTVNGCTFTGNSATEGGGIYNTAFATLDVRGSAFSGNTANDSGGGIYNLGTANVQQCTLSGNTASHDGGGIFNAASGTLAVKDSTVLGNTAPLGGDLFNAGIVAVNDSIIGDWFKA
jgi:predicted outer membrane repeat protein